MTDGSDADDGSQAGNRGDAGVDIAELIGVDADELAGVVDLFGALSPPELHRAIEELAFKRGRDVDDDAIGAAVEAALATYALVRYETDETRLVPGPAAFPTLPENAADLPHILEIPTREVDREAAGRAVAERLNADAADAAEAGDQEAIRRLLDVTYDVEVWTGDVAVDDVRDRLDDALDAE